jgi:hypothetical protein
MRQRTAATTTTTTTPSTHSHVASKWRQDDEEATEKKGPNKGHHPTNGTHTYRCEQDGDETMRRQTRREKAQETDEVHLWGHRQGFFLYFSLYLILTCFLGY